MISWIKDHDHGCVLHIYVQPGASRSEVTGVHGERLKVKIKAPPRDGEANEELIRFFSELLGIGKGKVHLLRGESSRQKDILVELPSKIVLTYFEELC